MGKKKSIIKDGDIVLPGDYLGVIEEFLPGEGVIEVEGELRATCSGKVKVDSKKRIITVEPLTDQPPLPKPGDIVIGKVIEVKPQAVLVQLIRIEGRENDREIAMSKLAGIHISQVKEGYVKNLSDEFKVGDIVRAKVLITVKSPIQLTTKGDEFGVVFALCSRCRTPLVRRDEKLICPKCGSVETRKLSRFYRKLVIQ